MYDLTSSFFVCKKNMCTVIYMYCVDGSTSTTYLTTGDACIVKCVAKGQLYYTIVSFYL